MWFSSTFLDTIFVCDLRYHFFPDLLFEGSIRLFFSSFPGIPVPVLGSSFTFLDCLLETACRVYILVEMIFSMGDSFAYFGSSVVLIAFVIYCSLVAIQSHYAPFSDVSRSLHAIDFIS